MADAFPTIPANVGLLDIGWAVYQSKLAQETAKLQAKLGIAQASATVQSAQYNAAAAAAAAEASKAAPPGKPVNMVLLIGGGIAAMLGVVLLLKHH